MSSLDRLRSFAESRSCPDHAIIQAGLTYGDARMLFTGIECMRAELAEAERQRDAARLERDSGAGKILTYAEPTGAGDFDELCSMCHEPVAEPHTWAECLRKLSAHRDHLLWFAATLEHERDAARLELRALEWLHNESAFENGLVFRRGGHLWTLGGAWERGAFRDRETEHESYASAARALGWEG